MFRCSVRRLNKLSIKPFQLPSSYKPNSRVVERLPYFKRLTIWLKSLQPGRLEYLQKRLADFSFPLDSEENANVAREFTKTPVDNKGNVISEVAFEVVNDPSLVTKHIVFIHGYGASSGCFARNFQLINSFKGLNHNYKIHFLDNLSFGLSSNPSIPSIKFWDSIPRVDHITMEDNDPTDNSKLYKKYYKLIDGYHVDSERFRSFKDKMTPLLKDLESYYVDALEMWRKNSAIDKIDFLIGHSFGGYWSGSYALKYPKSLSNLILLSPVGVERHAACVTAPIPENSSQVKPSLDPSSHKFLSRLPILSKKTTDQWYNLQPYLPRLLKWMGPFGVTKYYNMWYNKLYSINKVIEKLGGSKVFTNANQLKFGTNSECQLLIEYLYNSITSGTNSDLYVKYLLTPATTSKWPLYDKFAAASEETLSEFKTHFVYGQYDFMCSEAGEKLVEELNSTHKGLGAEYHIVAEGGHNLYIQNPFGTNKLLETLVKAED